MRPVLHTDLITAASALLTVPRGQRWRAARDLVMQADAADRYRQRTGKAHADWGNGTLMAAALARIHTATGSTASRGWPRTFVC